MGRLQLRMQSELLQGLGSGRSDRGDPGASQCRHRFPADSLFFGNAQQVLDLHRRSEQGNIEFARGQSADAVEGVTAFLEKRPASFPDRVSDGLPDVMPGWSAPAFE